MILNVKGVNLEPTTHYNLHPSLYDFKQIKMTFGSMTQAHLHPSLYDFKLLEELGHKQDIATFISISV